MTSKHIRYNVSIVSTFWEQNHHTPKILSFAISLLLLYVVVNQNNSCGCLLDLGKMYLAGAKEDIAWTMLKMLKKKSGKPALFLCCCNSGGGQCFSIKVSFVVRSVSQSRFCVFGFRCFLK